VGGTAEGEVKSVLVNEDGGMPNPMLADELSGRCEDIILPIASISDENHFDAEKGSRKDVIGNIREPSLRGT
jgi:hypothetical protein